MKHNSFAKVASLSLIIFTLSFFTWFNFAKPNSHVAKAVNENYTIQTVDYITFDGSEYIDTGIDQIGDTKVVADFQYDQAGLNQGYSQVFGARCGVDNTPTVCPVGSNDDAFIFGYQQSFGKFNAWYSTHGGANTANAGGILTADTARHTVTFDNNQVSIDGTLYWTSSQAAPMTARMILLGGIPYFDPTTGTESLSVTDSYIGRIYSFQIYKGQCSDSGFANQTDCETAGDTWSQVLVRNLVPAVKYSGCGANFTVEYGFIDQANGDQWYGNANVDSNGNPVGTLIGSPAISAPACPTEPETPTEPTTPESPTPPAVLPPNTGV